MQENQLLNICVIVNHGLNDQSQAYLKAARTAPKARVTPRMAPSKDKAMSIRRGKTAERSGEDIMVLLELAASRKSIAGLGVPLPPEQDTLLSPNYQHTEYVSF
ncbi:hypothetical protein F2Q70_00042959 [Brassica cretica]|uniref:Uncharacterized protein n=1 Tax=Brassica cretica TaxID=69181 RepID=A0A8S9KFP3_BRACR|nr:hypothetical protein F2Q70_00042959 [Brassica cretica]